jgi:hypothetical protein
MRVNIILYQAPRPRRQLSLEFLTEHVRGQKIISNASFLCPREELLEALDESEDALRSRVLRSAFYPTTVR